MFKIILVLIRVKLCACAADLAVAFAEVEFNSLRLLFLVKASQPYFSLCRREQKHIIEFNKKNQTAHYAEGITDTITTKKISR